MSNHSNLNDTNYVVIRFEIFFIPVLNRGLKYFPKDLFLLLLTRNLFVEFVNLVQYLSFSSV